MKYLVVCKCIIVCNCIWFMLCEILIWVNKDKINKLLEIFFIVF